MKMEFIKKNPMKNPMCTKDNLDAILKIIKSFKLCIRLQIPLGNSLVVGGAVCCLNGTRRIFHG